MFSTQTHHISTWCCNNIIQTNCVQIKALYCIPIYMIVSNFNHHLQKILKSFNNTNLNQVLWNINQREPYKLQYIWFCLLIENMINLNCTVFLGLIVIYGTVCFWILFYLHFLKYKTFLQLKDFLRTTTLCQVFLWHESIVSCFPDWFEIKLKHCCYHKNNV